MKPIHILIIDDQYGRDGIERMDLLAKTGIVETGIGQRDSGDIQAIFCSGQIQQGNELRNDYGVIAQAVAQGSGRSGNPGWDLVLLDVRFDSQPIQSDDDTFGLRMREWLRRDFPDLPVVMFSSKQQKEIENPHEHYLSKDGINEHELKRALLDYGQLSLEQARHLLGLGRDIIFASQEMLKVYRDAYIHAASISPILILGESGSGKEVLAKYIHRISSRNDREFVAINMAAIPENLIEAELFGHEKGAFTGAAKAMKGRFEAADNGTLFLDEIGDMPLLMQPKVLRAIQEGKIRRIGSEKDLSVDVRLISATHRNLEDQISTKAFREDLFHRINRVTIAIPPLRERRADILPLAQALLEKAMAACDIKKKGISFSESAKGKLEGYDFPGNVRELENMIERLVGETGNHRVISAEDIKFPTSPNGTAKTVGQGASAPQSLQSSAQGAAEPTVPSSTQQATQPAVTLANLHEILATLSVESNDPALRGVKPRLEQALKALMQRCAGAALERCKDHMKGEYRRQPAMQLLTGDEDLKGKGPERVLNEILERNQTTPVLDEDLQAMVDARGKNARGKA
jgi:DNA-binding NtrC family response regulator